MTDLSEDVSGERLAAAGVGVARGDSSASSSFIASSTARRTYDANFDDVVCIVWSLPCEERDNADDDDGRSGGYVRTVPDETEYESELPPTLLDRELARVDNLDLGFLTSPRGCSTVPASEEAGECTFLSCATDRTVEAEWELALRASDARLGLGGEERGG